jgi:Mor family transcriptional regulator
MDMMEFCKAWLAGIKTPRVLTEAIRRRYLLVLGNNYSDWLYRFICFSLNNNMEGMRTMLMVNQHYEDDAPLIQFLHRLETFIQRDPVQVVAEIESRINKREQASNGNHDNATYKNDVFLSYSRKDEELVRRLYAMLSAQGLRVWYDRHDIGEGDNWRQAIMAGIHDSRIFVPLLTTNVEQEIMEEHEYRAEWKEAANMAARMGGRTFIVPLAEKGFDFYNQLTDVPAEFQERNATWFDISTDLGQVADVIEQKVNEVKLLEEKMRNGRNS